MIAVIDYGMGNLRSVQKALEVVGAKTKLTSLARDIKKASKIVFPGVGAFGEAMVELKKFDLIDPIKDAIRDGKPFLGLCLGLQLLFEKSEEDPGVKGLCMLEGESKRFVVSGQWSVDRKKKEILKVPHMGWNSITRSTVHGPRSTKILSGVPNGSYMYFVHSYYVKPKDKSITLTTTDYGIDFVSGICKDNIYGLQFHPEKSQDLGLKILKNFVRMK
jgi:imidazole glycerol-phosphate synthase subunit HisH